MKIGTLTFHGKTSSSYGMIVSGAGTFNPAEPDKTAYSVPGRNGDIIQDNHRFKNIDVTYPAFIAKQFQSQVQNIRSWIYGSGTESYAELTDNFDTTHFRYAIGKSVNFEPVWENTAANMSITFNCKPQRFLTSGTSYSMISSGGTLANPTQFTSKPIIQVRGVTNGATITFSNAGMGVTGTMTATDDEAGIVFIDCEKMCIYDSGDNMRNGLFSGDFFEILPGTTTVTHSGFTYVRIAPWWWEL